MALPKLNVPQYTVELPSTGELISMRPFLVREEKVLMIALESNDPVQISNAVRTVIESCYDLEDMDSLTNFDIEMLFLQLRAKSVGENMRIQVKCQHDGCEGMTPVDINVDDVVVDNIGQEKTVILDEKTKLGIEFKYPSVNDIVKMDLEKIDSFEGTVDFIAGCVAAIFDENEIYDADHDEIKEFLETLNGEQFRNVQQWFNNAPSVYYNLQFVCEKCGKPNEVELRGLNSFFS